MPKGPKTPKGQFIYLAELNGNESTETAGGLGATKLRASAPLLQSQVAASCSFFKTEKTSAPQLTLVC